MRRSAGRASQRARRQWAGQSAGSPVVGGPISKRTNQRARRQWTGQSAGSPVAGGPISERTNQRARRQWAGQSAGSPAAGGRCQGRGTGGAGAAMDAPRGERDPPDALQNRIHAERAKRERRWRLLFTKYTVNPYHPSEASRHRELA